MEFPRRRPADNLVALDTSGALLWTAENLDDSAAAYTRIISAKPLCADNFCSYRCTLDADTGRILSKIFFK
jgi:hypothetical protein